MCTSVDELRACWGFGGKGVLVDKYGEMFLEALAPYVSELRRVHAAATVEAEARDSAKREDSQRLAAAQSTPAEATGRGSDAAAADEQEEEEVARMPEKPEELLSQIKDVRPLAKRHFEEGEALHKA